MSDNNTANDRYSRNSLFITPDQQNKIKNTRILFGGVGLGSVIAEAALRLGFENFVLLDADEVEISNLNRQNYTLEDVGKPKVEAITKRLKAINPDVKIEYHKIFLAEDNVEKFIKGCDVAINALDYDTRVPFVFDDICLKYNIPVLHPINFSWAAMLFVITNDSMRLTKVAEQPDVTLVLSFLLEQIEKQYPSTDLGWFRKIPDDIQRLPHLPLPQMSVGANLIAGLAASILFDIVVEARFKLFPELYFVSAK